ncbi:MAG: hypothetical protein UW71_C0002G0020 [Parcubacteria group bacterium GW2011_GWB1_44_7]|nr:MAG: hypothetical protein UW71_C0002G0020 [Parcubacteria group bacterium GW2011_GWB1_44_7]
MPRGLNNWTFADVKSFLQKRGFQLNGIEGGHHCFVGFYDSKQRQVTVSFHGAKAIHPRVLKSIVRQSGIPQKEWMKRI